MSCLLYYLGILSTFMLGNMAHCQGATPHLSQPTASTRSGMGMYLQIQQPETPHLRLNIWWTDTIINPEADVGDFFPQW